MYKPTLLVTVIMLITSIYFSNANANNFPNPIVLEYSKLVTDYNRFLSLGDYQNAFTTAKKLLDIDPSDTVSYLRLALVSENICLNFEQIIVNYAPLVSEGNESQKAIKDLANILLSSKNNHKCK
ncbi:hypothetical protein C2869_16875 [Saccharobesus litoralis]|uniref:Uncharacterized protein n=1 Tax=Saccharobesus litoralis TaxID=2172099 RepID=A0A2S0VUU7_9ALTE|nr:hypothetical protein [Saccharobesus litoralis]AWB67994.1 hypothetical protein C2869_16875 [Saccharobesus litoralis]